MTDNDKTKDYSRPECQVIPVLTSDAVLAVSGGGLDEEDDPVF